MKKNKRAILSRRRRRFIANLLKPIGTGITDTVELILICTIIAMFRFVITGKIVFSKGYILQAMFLIFSLISILGAEMDIVKRETKFDIVFIFFSKIIRAFLSIVSIFIVCIA